MGLIDKIFKRKTAENPMERIAGSMNSQADLMAFLKQSMGLDDNVKFNTAGPSCDNYGLCAENPIIVSGPVGTNAYLARLRTPSGQKLNWKRIGSTGAEGVPGSTDVYTGTLDDGSQYITIFVNWYGSSNATEAPEGLVI